MSESPENPPRRSGPSVDHLNLPRALVVTALFLIVAFVFLQQGTFASGTGGSGGTPATVTTTTTAKAPTTTLPKAQTKVQVANASATPGAATKITQQLQTLGWNTLPPVNATAQVPSSKIYYAQGRKAAARSVAADLKLPKSSIAPLTTSVPVPGAAGDDVVILVGPDLAS